MAKCVVLSFDDGRKDTYTNAVPIMLENDIRATINITTNFIELPNNCGLFPNVPQRSMSIQNILEIYEKGFEIANHGANHKNTIEDIEKANSKLEEWGIPVKNIGFASPYSYITYENSNEVLKLIEIGKLSYVRSGIQIKRENFIYKLLYIIMRITKSPYLFYLLNKTNIFNITKSKKFFKGITITKDTTLNQIKKLIQMMPNETSIILNFHSILDSQEIGYDDKWVWDKENFKFLCIYLKNKKDIKIVKTIDLISTR